MDLNLSGIIRGLFAKNVPENGHSLLTLNNRGDFLVAQALPELTEVVRLGQSWQAPSTTGQAALTALPTTVSGLTLTNNEPSGGASYAIDSFGSWEAVLDATQTDVTALFAMLNKRGSTAPTGGTSETTNIRSLSGKPNYGGGGSLLRGATVVNDGWFAHGTPGAQMAAAAAGANWKVNEAPVRGLYLVTPGSSFSIQAVKAAAAAAAQQFFFIRWHEVQVIWKS